MRSIDVKKYLKLTVLMFAAYMVVNFSMNNVFLANTPKINPFAMKNIQNKASNFFVGTSEFIASINPLKRSSTYGGTEVANSSANSKEEIAGALAAPLTQMSQGVYAGEKNDIKVFEVRTDEIGNEFREYTFNINGKEVKIKVPNSQEPPTEDDLNGIF